MSACPVLNFKNVTIEVWGTLVQSAKEQFGVDVSSYQGQISDKGFTITWNCNISAGTATVQCTDSPFFVPCSLINSKMVSFATSCGAVQA